MTIAGAAVVVGASFWLFRIVVLPPIEGFPAAIEGDAALVLSGDVDYLRARRGADLYLSRRVGALIVTGAGIGGDSAQELRRFLLKAGVPDRAILVEAQSTTTRENILFVSPLIRSHGFRRVALVTSCSHMARAVGAARSTMPEVEWLPVAVPDAGPASRVVRMRLEEWVKLLYYAARGWV